jgi:hypothetical protein
LYYFIMMSVSEILFLAIVVYILYRFVANFLLPVVRATRQVREQFRNMQGPGNDQGGAFGQDQRGAFGQPGQAGRSANKTGQTGPTGSTSSTSKRPAAKPPADDYIDFEEIK